VLHGGHFYGGHIAFAMDSLKTAVANVADLLDRQLALMVDQRYNHGLPANLSGATGPRAAINHGLKAAADQRQSAWTAEALKLTMPASGVLAFHRMPQPGQGQHGHHRRTRLPARTGADRAGRSGPSSRCARAYGCARASNRPATRPLRPAGRSLAAMKSAGAPDRRGR
jgi:hypothetical protein